MVNKPSHTVTLGGILAAFTILLQSSPVFLSGLGLLISPFATLPIAIATMISPFIGLISYFTAYIILLLISPQEAFIFLFTTGSLGFSLGFNTSNRIVFSILISSGTVFIGINVLVHLVGLPVFGEMTPDSSLIVETIVFFWFSILYSVIWYFIFKFFIKALCRIKEFKTLFLAEKSKQK